jgi:hypothetical protein
MHLLITPASAVILLALVVTPSSQVMAQGIGFVRTADKIGASAGRLYHQAKAKRAGGCGAYMYWSKGKCMDARNKK